MEKKQIQWHPVRIIFNTLFIGIMVATPLLIWKGLFTWDKGGVPAEMLPAFILLLLNTQIDWKYGGSKGRYLAKYDEIKKEFGLIALKVRNGDISSSNIVVDNIEFEYLGQEYGDDPDIPAKVLAKNKDKIVSHVVLFMHNMNTGAMYGQYGIYVSTGRKIE
jgi:hypothetical protein